MSREIKFRIWNGKEFLGPATPKDLIQGFPGPESYGFTDDLVFQQFTGLTDKNGREIYEGDICKGLVDCGPGGFIEHLFPILYDPIKGYQWECFFLPKLEIIGNIFENPYLNK